MSNRNDGKSSKYDGFIICDVCGRKIRRSKSRKITDSFNTLYGLLVCQADFDKTNPQNYPDFQWKESIVDPRYVRSEADPQYLIALTGNDIENSIQDPSIVGGILASAPRYLRIVQVASTYVKLAWMSPESCGSRGLLGWAIKRENPVGGGFSVINSNTNSVDLSYTDLTTTSGIQYNYKVAAVTRAGTGTYSDSLIIQT